MTFDYPGYDIKFIQKEPCKDITSHEYTLVFKFFSPVTKLHYIIRADYHKGDVFAIKFYCKQHRRSDRKYSIIINKGDIGNIFVTCIKVIPYILIYYPNASFGISGARTLDKKGMVEDYKNNQRYRIYKELIPTKIGRLTFEHIEYEHVSSYLLVNRNCTDIQKTEKEIKQMFCNSYTDLFDVV
ncbi:hypothetical protein [Runella aurantiaca]|uniref:Uncharacterized protein n=1 Tax=Runella aurantiaca TaxID=2282308 RepID=A0A369I3J0_9BACT|nr:hypothetical protein [Runella aurantiaca]RDB03480.1 hypothetical protein DVG78_23485 [Runella aurantiaca]